MTPEEEAKILAYLNSHRHELWRIKFELSVGWKWSGREQAKFVETWLEERLAEEEEKKRKEYLELINKTNDIANQSNSISEKSNEIAGRSVDISKTALKYPRITIILTVLMLFVAYLSYRAAKSSSDAAWKSTETAKESVAVSKRSVEIAEQMARQENETYKAKFRPYIIIRLARNKYLSLDSSGLPYVTYSDPIHQVLPNSIENIGSVPALNVIRSYKSYLIRGDSDEHDSIQDFGKCEDEADALMPGDISPPHNDNINIFKFNPSDIDNVMIGVALRVTYQGFSEIDSRIYYSEKKVKLKPVRKKDGSIVFYILYDKLDFRFATEEDLCGRKEK